MKRLSADVRPEHYALELVVDPRRDDFRGRLALRLQAPAGTRSLELHSVDLEIEEVSAEDSRGELAVSGVKPHAEHETIELQLARPLEGESATLHLRYRGPLRRDLRGLYLARSGERRYAATQLEAADARRMFPCFDEPDKKARFELTVQIPKAARAVSNGAIAAETIRGTRKIVRFRETPPLSTYLVALVVGDLECSRARRCGKTPIRVWHVPGKSHLTGFALEAAVASLERLERYFGLAYPYGKLDLIAVPDFEFGAMENAGAVTFRETLLLVDPKTVTLAEKKRVAEVIAHELAHMWFGDLVTMAWWDDLWLNEAFATWMAFSIVDDWMPEWEMWLDFQHHRAAAFSLDGLKNTHPIYVEVDSPDEATENFDAITYEKGASVVRMLEHWLGAAKFKKGVRSYIRTHREGNAQAADLWKALGEASGTAVAPMVRAWIERPGFPLLSVKRVDRGKRAWLDLEQERFFASARVPAEERSERWPIPVVLRVRGRGAPRRVRDLVGARRGKIELGDAADVRWAYANADEGGFYRPLHDGPLLEALVGELGKLTPAERMGLVGHQWAGVRAGRAPLGDFLSLVAGLADEPRHEILEAALGPLYWLADQVEPQLADGDAAAYRLWLSAVFKPAWRELGWQAPLREGDPERARRAVLLRLIGGVAEDAELLEQADQRVESYLRDRSALEANLAGPVVELGARVGGKRRYENYLRIMRKANTPQERTRFELALGSFREPALVLRTLELLLGDDVPTQDVVPLLIRLLANPAGREATWSFIQGRWDALEPRISTGLAPRLVTALPALQTKEHRVEVTAFFKKHPLPSATRALKQALEIFALDAELRRRATRELARWLAKHSNPRRTRA